MKYTLLMIIFFSHLFATDLNDIRSLFKEVNYKVNCNKNILGYIQNKYRKHEEALNIYSHSCMEIDMINSMSLSIHKLIKTPETRANAVYYSTILYQKKLLYHSLIDGVDISYISLPKTNYVLSKVFDKYVKKDYIQENDKFIIQDDTDKNVSYQLYTIKDDNNIYKVIIETYKNGTIVKTRAYW